MANIGFVRIQKECKEIILCQELQANGITIEPLSESLTEISGTIRGPPDSPYENGTFTLVKLTSAYLMNTLLNRQRLNLQQKSGILI